MPVKTKNKPSTTTTTPKAIVTGKYSGTLEARQAIRDALFSTGDDREFFPLDYSLIRPIVKDKYLAIFDDAVETGEPAMVEIDLNKGYNEDQPITENPGFQFAHGWLKANGKNRTPKPNHYGMLATAFQAKFVPDATHWVIDSNGMVANAGHSGHGVALAFYPECVEYGIDGKRVVDTADQPILAETELGQEELAKYDDYPGFRYVDSAGYVCQSIILPWKGADAETSPRRGQVDETKTYVYGTDTPGFSVIYWASISLCLERLRSVSCSQLPMIR